LSLLTRSDASALLPSGARAVVPGQPEESELYRRVTALDEPERMPPEGDPLSPQEIGRLRRWIADGAHWDRHWAFQPLRRPELPQVVTDLAWVRGPVDRFVLHRLDVAGVTPSPEADRFTLIRRLYLDLIGLLPRSEDVEAFCRDLNPVAYEQLVERLLASPHFGERWGRHWLDQARYADTDGFEVDGPRHTAWLWRDWVIDAWNEDMPFDQFTVEQIAGDLLTDATPRQRLATGFHRQSLTNREGGIDQEEARYKELVDRVNAVGTIWLSLTVGCAQCHNHPYDPFTQREYFELYAFFNQTEDTELAVPPVPPGSARNDTDRGKSAAQVAALVIAQSNDWRPTTMYERGDFLRPGEVVQPNVFRELHPLLTRVEVSKTPDRLDLARWITHRDNCLMPRVAANQVWMRLFGAGLVRTPDDFGARGDPPTDPRLLDWLADEYRHAGWSTKHLIRLIVTSATYRQSSRQRPEVQSADPLNQLWHRQNRYRVEAELVRDLGLSASGLLTQQIGGPSCYPPLPAEIAKLSFRSNYVWTASTGSDRYRRGMYILYKRTLPHPNLDTFDCPDATAARMQRETSNTPLQALTSLNNEVFVEAAQALGQRVLTSTPPEDRRRIDSVFRLCLGRPVTESERATLQELLAVHRKWYREHAEDARMLVSGYSSPDVDVREAAAWVALCNVVLNLDEFLTRE